MFVKAIIVAVLAPLAFAALLKRDDLEPNGKQCILGIATSDSEFPGGDPASGAGANTVVHQGNSFLLGKDGSVLATNDAGEHWDTWVGMDSSFPNVASTYCSSDDGKTGCPSCRFKYGDQYYTTGDNGDRCVGDDSAGPFTATTYCACYIDC
ncbi:hypothetical protein OE88DRAFT_1733505 [Heliocybe sulcata]|uniref:Uncharacterized protein n=1 Tax=Heliocybe sulcata TaxID=5364 RepID=A0A5C3N9S4_9AGAM|nr:hypothetical protein OE88DRAFT_1733505 [Heliocybe sulcata]